MQHSESIQNIAVALVAAQALLKAAPKDKENPYFSSKYADLASCMETLREPMHENGLAITQLPSMAEGKVLVETVLIHKTGEWISCTLACTPKDEGPQAAGSAITYLRRYGLAVIGLVSEEDDDGNSAEGDRKGKPQTSAAPSQNAGKAPQSQGNSTPGKTTPPATKPAQKPAQAPQTPAEAPRFITEGGQKKINDQWQAAHGLISGAQIKALQEARNEHVKSGDYKREDHFSWAVRTYLDPAKVKTELGLYVADIRVEWYEDILLKTKSNPAEIKGESAESAGGDDVAAG